MFFECVLVFVFGLFKVFGGVVIVNVFLNVFHVCCGF